MKIVKKFANIILSFLLFITIISMVAMNLLESKLLDKNYIFSKMNDTEFYLQVSRDIENGFENYVYQSGLPEDIFKDLIPEEVLKSDIDSIVNYVYNDSEITISNQKIVDRLDEKINKYLNEQNLKLNKQGKDNIFVFEQIISDVYYNNLNFSDTIYKSVQNVIVKVNDIYSKFHIVPSAICIILVILLIVINRKDLLTAINFGLISMFSSGIILNICQKLVFKNFDLDNIMIITASLSNFVINIIKEILYEISDIGNTFMLIGFSGIIIISVIKNIDFKNKNS